MFAIFNCDLSVIRVFCEIKDLWYWKFSCLSFKIMFRTLICYSLFSKILVLTCILVLSQIKCNHGTLYGTVLLTDHFYKYFKYVRPQIQASKAAAEQELLSEGSSEKIM